MNMSARAHMSMSARAHMYAAVPCSVSKGRQQPKETEETLKN